MSLDLARAMLVRLLLTVNAGSPFAARCWLTSVTTACSAALSPETFAVDAVLEDADGETVEVAVLDEAEEADLEEAMDVVWEEAEDVGLEDAGADAAAEVQWEDVDERADVLHPVPAEVQPAFCDGAAADGQVDPETTPQGVLPALLQEDVLQAAFVFFCPNSDRTYCCTSLQVPWTQQTTVLHAESSGLLELAVVVCGHAAAADRDSTAVVTVTAMIFFHVKRKVFPLLFGGGQTCRCAHMLHI